MKKFIHSLTQLPLGGILRLFRGVAQLEAHCVWDAGVGGSSPPTPTRYQLEIVK